MSGARKSYLEELAQIQERIHRLFERALLAPEFGGRAVPPGTWAPQVDLVETADAFLVHAELPGLDRDDVEVAVDDRRLELSGRRPPAPAGTDRFLQMERSYGEFRRAFDLPAPVDASRMEARMERGILHVTLPKAG